MEDTNYTKDNQIAIAVVKLLHNDEIFSQRKINFVSNGTDIVLDSIN